MCFGKLMVLLNILNRQASIKNYIGQVCTILALIALKYPSIIILFKMPNLCLSFKKIYYPICPIRKTLFVIMQDNIY